MFSIPKHSFCSFSSIAVLWLSMPLPSLQSNATTYPVSLQFNLWHVRCKKFPMHSTKISQFKKIPQKVKPVNIITLLRVIPTLAFQDIYFDIYFDNLPNILSDIYSDILSGILHFIWYMFWQSFWHIFWHSIWPLRSSGAHWARKVPGWGPAVPTGLGRSLVEVQPCPLRAEVGEERRVGNAEVDVEVEAEVVEEKEEDEEEEDKEEPEQLW